ncbi:MAG: hypothetical protein PVI00_11610 [Desulfobacterales bacterium]|jgi:hypothetical protein
MKRDNYPVAVYCLNPEYDLQRDYRLQFLKQLDVKVSFIYDEFDQTLGSKCRIHRLIGKTCFDVVNKIDNRSRSSTANIVAAVRRFAQKIGKKSFKHSRANFYNVPWARNFLEQSGAQALCFDHINPDRYIAEIFLTAAAEKSIPTIALPHGVFIYTNNFVRIGSDVTDRYDKFNRFDYVITQNELRRDVLVSAGVHREKILVMGSARYCNEWMTQNKKILPRTMKLDMKRQGRLRAVFMTTQFVYRIDVKRMLKTFDLLSEIEGIDAVVKPHTRTGKEAKVYENIPLTNVADISSVELCEWADVVMVIGSSIIIEPFKQGKPVLYLKYLHENKTQYEELGASWTIHNESELKNALLSLQDDVTSVPYTDENVNRFLSEIIYGGRGERDVLADYESFIVNRAMNKK